MYRKSRFGLLIIHVILLFSISAYSADIVLDTAEDISTNTTNFNGVLSGSDDNAQKAFDTIDDVCLENTGDTGVGNYTFTGDITLGDGDMDSPRINFHTATDTPGIYYDPVENITIITGDVRIGEP